MRLIDADALMRSHCVECTYYNSGECLGAKCDWDSIGHIREAKTVDAVPVVRCRECKYLRLTGTVWRCTNRIVMMICEPDDYCSRGEKSETDSLHECD